MNVLRKEKVILSRITQINRYFIRKYLKGMPALSAW